MSILDHPPTFIDVEDFIMAEGSDAAAHRHACRMLRIIVPNARSIHTIDLLTQVIERTE